jgi:hypothetical protein
MSFEEKIALAVHDFDAVAHLGIPPLRYTDGPNGIRGPDNVTAFPASLALAATFDERLAAAYGAAVAEEARDMHPHLLTAARPSRWRLSTPLRRGTALKPTGSVAAPGERYPEHLGAN